jgi:hypothetical protein
MTTPPISPEDLAALGPLATLLGEWSGEKGNDRAPSNTRGVANSVYREHMRFAFTGRVDNHEQILYGLRYATTAWRVGEPEPFHEELGYWMWDAQASQVMRCFMVPRGMTILAGGTVAANSKQIQLAAKLGSPTYGICSNVFLDREFQTVGYQLDLKILDANSIQYDEVTELKIRGQSEIFKHSDKNTLKRI